MDWFLYDHGLRHERVKKIFINCNTYDIFYLRYTSLDAMSLREPIKTSSRLKWQNYFSLQKTNKQKAKTDILCYEENNKIQQCDVWLRTFVYYFFFCVFTFILLLQEMDLGRPDPIPSSINSSEQGALKFNMFLKKKMQE